MWLRRACYLVGLVFSIAFTAVAGGRLECRFHEPLVQAEELSGFHIWLLRIPHRQETDDLDRECQATVQTPDGRTIFAAKDFIMAVHEATGSDISGDGHPDVVLEGYSGGAHCCWTYWIVSLGNPPGLLDAFYNERPASFHARKDGRVEIRTLDGVFDYFDGLSHAESFFPTVVLRLDGRTLRDISAEYRGEYEKEISAARSKLKAESLQRFRELQDICAIGGDEERECHVDAPEGEFMALRHVKVLVSTIVLSYLYSGREQEAWNALDEMWPPTDKERMKREFLAARACGILSHVYQSCPGKLLPSQEP